MTTQNNKTTLAGFRILLLTLLCTVCSFNSVLQAQDDDALIVRWGNGTTWTDIESLPTANQAEMTSNTGNVQMQVTAEFSGLNSQKTRRVTVDVPRGYMIKGYTVKEGTPAINGVIQLSLTDEQEDMADSSVLTARDGSPFINQKISGYTDGTNNASEYDIRTYEGKIVYEFNASCDHVVLTFTLAIDMPLITHTDTNQFTGINDNNYSANMYTSHILPPVTVDMVSGASSLHKEVAVRVSNIIVPYVAITTTGGANNGHSAKAEGVVNSGDPNTGTCDFNTGWTLVSYNSTMGLERPYIDEFVVTIPYKEGVTYKGFNLKQAWTVTQATNPDDYTSPNGHITVVNDETARTLTLTVHKWRWNHGGSNTALEVFWSVEIDGVINKWDDYIYFRPKVEITSGTLTGTPYTYLADASGTDTGLQNLMSIWRQPVRPSISITLTRNDLTRRDLNADQDFPYDWAIGRFRITNNGPSVVHDLKYEFTFPSSPQIRGVRIPCGGSGTTDVNVNVTGLTSTGRTLNYSLALYGYIYGSGAITSEALELADDEYLVNLTIVQETLQVADYVSGYTIGQTTYYGRFINGQEGDVTLTLSSAPPPGVTSNLPQTTISHTNIGWLSTGVGTIEVTASDKGYPSMTASSGGFHVPPGGDQRGGSFYPGDPIYFDVNCYAGGNMGPSLHANEITDPTFYINLPEGIDLDPTSIEVFSIEGRNGNAFVPASVTGSPNTQIINGVRWTSYRIQVNNKYDIIARNTQFTQNEQIETNNIPLATFYKNREAFTLRFKANVGLASPAYSPILMEDVVTIDLGQSALNGGGTDNTRVDIHNWAGKGTSYKLATGSNENGEAPNIYVIQREGLNVSLGIRVFVDNNTDGINDNTEPFYTYNGTDVSIATVTGDHDAEIRIEYENTSSQPYYEGSEIYLPIPKIGLNYDHFFYNTFLGDSIPTEKNLDPHEPQWTAMLKQEVDLDGFDTYYSIETNPTTNYNEVDMSGSWVPVTLTWYTYDDLIDAGHTLAEVTMLKFVAIREIAKVGDTGSRGATTFRISLEDGSTLGTINYWRSFQRGWRYTYPSGTWHYGSVMAAEPAMAGVFGQFFFDANRNGKLDAGEDDSTILSQFIGTYKTTLSGTGIIGSPEMEIVSDGTFRSVAGNLYYFLREGNYTVTIINDAPANWHITDVTLPSDRSRFENNIPVWYNDIPQGQIRPDNTQAAFTFIVDENSINLQLVGIGIKNPPEIIPINPHIRVRLNKF